MTSPKKQNVPVTRPVVGRGLFYGRESIARYEQSRESYIQWAKQQADHYGVQFEGNVATLERMIANGSAEEGDVYFDFGIPGNVLSRPGLTALLRRIEKDPDVTHVFIFRRDRLLRPDDVGQGMSLENDICRKGVTIVYSDKVLPPLKRKEHRDLSGLLMQAIEFHGGAAFRTELAQKIIWAQLVAAKKGLSTGGRAPYGFRRALVGPSGDFIRLLSDGEIVRMQGHHVVWVLGPEQELEVIRRILEELEFSPASQVARNLTLEGVPTPDTNRVRTDNGVRHRTSGTWHATTVTNIARNPMLVALKTYGRRSMGDQQRAAINGPRDVQNTELHEDNRPKVVTNPHPIVEAPSGQSTIIDPARHRKLIEKLDSRGTTQRGKPRSRDPNKNPLGSRVYDMACGWPMYRNPRGDSFDYKCGLYQQSSGAKCRCNHVDGPSLARFALAALRQFALAPSRIERLKAALERRLASENQRPPRKSGRNVESELKAVRDELRTIEANLARAKSDAQFEIISRELDALRNKENALVDLLPVEPRFASPREQIDKIAAALQLCAKLETLADDPSNFKQLAKLFAATNLELYLQFAPVTKKVRETNQLTGGVITIGNAPPPIKKYTGLTSRRALKLSRGSADDVEVDLPQRLTPSGDRLCGDSADGRRKSIGNVNRGERI